MPAARGQPFDKRAAGQAAADDDRAPFIDVKRCRRFVTPHPPRWREFADQHRALEAEAVDLAPAEAGFLHAALDLARTAPGRERRPDVRHPRQRFKDRRCPQFGILRRREAVEIERIGAQRERRQHVERIAERERQRYAAALEFEPLHARHKRRPGVGEFAGQRADGRIGDRRVVRAAQIGRPQRMLFHRHEMQPLAPRCVAAPRCPAGEEVDACAEAGFHHRENATPPPAFGQPITLQEHEF